MRLQARKVPALPGGSYENSWPYSKGSLNYWWSKLGPCRPISLQPCRHDLWRRKRHGIRYLHISRIIGPSGTLALLWLLLQRYKLQNVTIS